MSTFLRIGKLRDERLCREHLPTPGPGRIGKRNFAGNPERNCPGEKAALLLTAGTAQGIFHLGKTIVNRDRHAWETTTASLLTWVFEHNGYNPSYLIGGIPNNSGKARDSPRANGHHRGR